MSDILIRGMKMPKNCKTCRFNDSDLFCSITKGDIDRDDYTCHICPLIEVPPHSDLVDRNKLLGKAHYDYNEATHDYNKFRVVFEDDIIDAPVVIEGNIDGSEIMK